MHFRVHANWPVASSPSAGTEKNAGQRGQWTTPTGNGTQHLQSESNGQVNDRDSLSIYCCLFRWPEQHKYGLRKVWYHYQTFTVFELCRCILTRVAQYINCCVTHSWNFWCTLNMAEFCKILAHGSCNRTLRYQCIIIYISDIIVSVLIKIRQYVIYNYISFHKYNYKKIKSV